MHDRPDYSGTNAKSGMYPDDVISKVCSEAACGRGVFYGDMTWMGWRLWRGGGLVVSRDAIGVFEGDVEGFCCFWRWKGSRVRAVQGALWEVRRGRRGERG